MRNERSNSLFILVLMLLMAGPLQGQFNTYSPYTRFGLGDLNRPGLGQNMAMGGTGIGVHEDRRINYLNPASFTSMDSSSVYFDFGFNAYTNSYETTEFSNFWWNGNLHHVAFASSMGKHFGLSFGVVPYSSIGYSVKQEYDDFVNGSAMDIYHKGEGGIMDIYLGASVKVLDRLSFGVTMNYLMGKLTRERQVNFPMNSTYSDVVVIENVDMRKPVFTLGMQYKEVFGDRFFFTLGAVYDLEVSSKASNEAVVTNVFYNQTPAFLNDSVRVDPVYLLGEGVRDNDFTIPERMGFGLSFGIPDKLVIAADYSMQDWSGSMSEENFRSTLFKSYNAGVEYTPDMKALRGYHKLMTYRLGGYYSDSYLEVNSQQLSDFGITFGVGMPVRNIRSSFNLSFTYGSRGTTDFNLVKENYGIVSFSVTLHDLWFRQRRFD